LKKLGVVLKRAKYFLTAGGRYLGGIRLDGPRLMERMLAPARRPARLDQLELFAAMPDASALTGEL
jgi:predicted DNA-binding helix-hairpin-helix protein